MTQDQILKVIEDKWLLMIKEAVLAEREACARVCDELDISHWGCEVKATWCSEAIRARGEGQAFPTASHHLKLKQEHDGQAEFQRFVKSELGDIAVLDDDKLLSENIKTYWRVWCASRGVKS